MGVVHLLEVIEVEQQQSSDPAIARYPRVRSRQSILQERAVRQPRERVVKCLVRQLSGERPLLGDVALGAQKVQRLAVGVLRRGPGYLGDDHAPVLAKVALGVAHLVDLVRDQTDVGLFSNPHVLGKGEPCGVVTEQFFSAKSDHVAEGVVDRDGQVVAIAQDHGSHIVLEGETEALLGISEGTLGLSQRFDGEGRLFQRRLCLLHRAHVAYGGLGGSHYLLESLDRDLVERVEVSVVNTQGAEALAEPFGNGDRRAETEPGGALAPRFVHGVTGQVGYHLALARAQRSPGWSTSALLGPPP